MKKIRNILIIILFAVVLYGAASIAAIECNDNNYYAKINSGEIFVLKCGDPSAGQMDKTLYKRSRFSPFYAKVGDLDMISGYPTAIAFADEKTGFITVTYHGQDFSVYMSDDGGKTWRGIAVDIPDDVVYNYIDGEAVSFDDSGDGTLILDFVTDESVLKYEYDYIGSEGNWGIGDLLEITER